MSTATCWWSMAALPSARDIHLRARWLPTASGMKSHRIAHQAVSVGASMSPSLRLRHHLEKRLGFNRNLAYERLIVSRD